MVLVLRVVTMLDIGPGEFRELGGYHEFACRILLRSDPQHVLTAPFLPLIRRSSVMGENDDFLEMHMDRMAPAAAVHDVPDLKRRLPAEPRCRRSGGELRRSRNPPWV